MAFEVLERLGVDGFVFTLGHAGFPLGLLDEALPEGPDRSERRAEALRGLWRRDPSRIRGALGERAGPLVEALEFFGGREVLEEARRRPLPDGAREGVARLSAISRVLEDLELADRFRFDLAELRGFDYYTGLIFEAHAPGAGQEIGGGGRYNDLLANFGDPRPAVGFSLSVDRIAGILPESSDAREGATESVARGPDTRSALAARFRAARAARAAGSAVRFEPSS